MLEWLQGNTNLLAIILAPYYGALVIVTALAAWALGNRVGRATTRAIVVGAVLLASLALGWAALVWHWGWDWWTYTVPAPPAVFMMCFVPLVATVYFVWRHMDAALLRLLGVAAASVVTGTVLFVGLGLLLGAGAG